MVKKTASFVVCKPNFMGKRRVSHDVIIALLRYSRQRYECLRYHDVKTIAKWPKGIDVTWSVFDRTLIHSVHLKILYTTYDFHMGRMILLVIRFMTNLLQKYRGSVVIMVGRGGAEPHYVHNWPLIFRGRSVINLITNLLHRGPLFFTYFA